MPVKWLQHEQDALHRSTCALLVLVNRHSPASPIAALPEELLLRLLQPLTSSFSMRDDDAFWPASPTCMAAQRDINWKMRAIL
eukprot:6178010-Prymnesium_polylepis.1